MDDRLYIITSSVSIQVFLSLTAAFSLGGRYYKYLSLAVSCFFREPLRHRSFPDNGSPGVKTEEEGNFTEQMSHQQLSLLDSWLFQKGRFNIDNLSVLSYIKDEELMSKSRQKKKKES